MVRETRHLWIGNLPDNIREERILEHFKRYGKVQSVKILSKKDEDTSTVTATVAFIDIRSAAKAHNADNKIDERTLKTDYYEPPVSSAASSATCIYIHEKDDALGRPGAPPYTTPRPPRYAHCVPEERPYERPPYYYDRLGEREPYMRRPVGISYHEDENYQARGRSRDRFTRTASGSIYQDGTDRNQGHFPRGHTQRQHFDQRYPPSLDQYGDEREAASTGPGRLSWRSTITSSSISSTVDSPPHSRSGSRQRRKGTSRRSSHSRSGSRSNSRSHSRSRSSSHSSSDSRSSSSSSKHRSSSTDSSSRSPSPSKSQSPATSYGSQGSGKTGRTDWPSSVVTTASSLFLPPSVTTLNANSLSVGNQCSNQSQNCSSSPINNHSDKEERRPLGICVQNLPARSTDTSLKDGLFHEYKKHGKVTMVKVIGQGTDRYAVVCFKKADDVEKALEVSKDKLFFGCKIEVKAHEGLDGEDNEFRPFEADLDEFHPKATRTLFIGNLEKDITHLDLRKHFEQFGEIIEIDIKKQGATSTSLYAFIQFTNIASVVKAMRKLDGETLFGANRIKLGFGKSMPTCCVWIDGVVDSVSEKFLKRHFGRYGPVRNTVIDREKGQALVFYDSIDLAQNAVAEMRGRMLGSKRLQVDFASRECQTAFCEKLGLPGLEILPTDRLWERRDRREFDPLRDERDGRSGFDNRPYSRFEGQQRPGRGNFRGVPHGGFSSRGRGQPFNIRYENYAEDILDRRHRNFDEEYSQGSGASIEDSYEKELREYGYSQRERKEHGSEEQIIQGQSFSPLHRRDTNSISPSREKHRDNRSISPLARSERSSTRGSSRTDDHHSRHGGKEEGSEDGEKKEGNKFSESTVRQEKKKCKQRNSASDLESHQSQSPPHSRQHSRSRSPPSKEKKSLKTKDKLNNRLKSPNSSTWNSPSGDSVSNQEGAGFVSKETSVEQRHLQKHKLQEDKADLKDSVPISLPPVSTAEDTTNSVNNLKIKTETEHVRKRVHSNDFVEGHSKSDLSGQAERKRRLLSVGSLPSSRVTGVTQLQPREDCKSKIVNSNVTDSFSVKCKKIETSSTTSNNRTTPSEHSNSVGEHLTISHVEKQSSSDSANLKHVNILQFLEQFQDKGSSSDTECSVENRKVSKEGKLKTNSELNISDVVECTKISTKDYSCNNLGPKMVSNDDKTISSKVPFGISYIKTTEKNGLPETTDTQASRKPVDPRRSSEHHSVSSTSSLSAPQHMRKQSVYQAESSLDHSSKKFSGLLPTSFTYVEGDVDSSKEPSSTSFFRFQSKLKEDEVSSSSDNSTLPKLLRHSLSALPDLTRTFSPRLHSVSDEVTSAEHENKKGIIPLCLPLPKFAASLRSPKTSPNPLTSPKTVVSSPKSGHSPSFGLTSKMLPPHILREPPKSVQLGSPEPIKEIEERLKPDNVNSSVTVLHQVVNNADNLVKITMPTDVHLKIEKNTEVASDSECSPISSPGCIEERIKALDEKFTAWSGSNTSRSLTATTVASTEAPLQPTIDYQKYNIKKRPKFDYMAPKPSEIMKTLLAKSTIFDQDLKRLEHINEKYEPKEINLDFSPKVKPFFRTKAAAKEFSSPIQPLTNVTNAIGQGSLTMNKLPVSSCIGTTTTLSPPLTPPTMGSTTTITTTNVSQNFVVNHVTHSVSPQTIPFSPLTPVSAKISLPSPISCLTDSSLPQTKLTTQYLNVANFQNRTSNPHSPPFTKKESSTSQSTAPCVSTIKKSMPFITTSLTLPVSVTSESTQKDLFLPHCIKKESPEPKDISLKTKDSVMKDLPSKEENLQGYKNREHGFQKEIIKKEPFSFIETHTLKKEPLISPENDYLIDQNDSYVTIEDVKKEPLHDKFDMEISPVSQTGSNIKAASFHSNWETDPTRYLQVTSECKIENKETQSHQSEIKDQVNEPEPKRVKTHHTSSCKDIDKGDNKSSSPLQNESRKMEKKDKSSKSSDKLKSSVTRPENLVSLEKEETKGKSDMGKMKDDKKSKLKEISKHEGRVRTKSGDKGYEKNHGKNSQLTCNKARKEHIEREKTKSERKSFDSAEKNQSEKSKSEDAPVYFSMYDKVKARSSHNQSLKDQASLESMRKKFNQLKKSRAKKGDKSRSADMDSDKDSDEFSHFSSDLESKPKPSGKLKQGKKRKLVIESSSDEELSQSAFHFETSRDTKIAENSSDLLSDSDKDIQDVTSSNIMPTSTKSKKKKKKKIISDVEASNSQVDKSPTHMKNKTSKPRTKQTNAKSTKSKAMKSECETTDEEKTTKPKSKKKDFKKKRSKKDKITEIKSDSDLSDSDFSHFMVKRKEENKSSHMELKSDSESSDKEVFFHHNKDKSKTKDKIKIPELNFDSDFSVSNISHLSQTQAKEKAKKQYHELKYDSGLSESSAGLLSKVQKEKMKEQCKNENAGDSEPPPLMAVELNWDSKETIKGENNVKKDSKIMDDDQDKKQKPSPKKKKKSRKSTKGKEKKSSTTKGTCEKTKKTDNKARENIDSSSKTDSIIKQKYENSLSEPAESPPRLIPSIFSDIELRSDFSDYDFESQLSRNLTEQKSWNSNDVANDVEKGTKNNFLGKNFSSCAKMNVEGKSFEEEDKGPPPLLENVDFDHRELDDSNKAGNIIEDNSTNRDQTINKLVGEEPKTEIEVHKELNTIDDGLKKKKNLKTKTSICDKNVSSKDEKRKKKSKKQTKEKKKKSKNSACTVQELSLTELTTFPKSSAEHFHPFDEDSRLSKDEKLDEEIVEEARRLEEELLADSEETCCFESDELPKLEDKHQERKFEEEAAKETQRLEQELFSTDTWHMKVNKPFQDECLQPEGLDDSGLNDSKVSDDETVKDEDIYADLDINPSSVGYPETANFLLQSEEQADFKLEEKSGVAEEMDKQQKMEDDLAVSALLQAMNGDDLPAPDLQKETDYLDSLLQPHPEEHTFNYLFQDNSSSGLVQNSGSVSESQEEIPESKDDNHSHLFEEQMPIYSQNLNTSYPPVVNTSAKTYLEKSPKISIEEERTVLKIQPVSMSTEKSELDAEDSTFQTKEKDELLLLENSLSENSHSGHVNIQHSQKSPESLFERVENPFQKSNSDEKDLKLSPQPSVSDDHDTILDTQEADQSEISKAVETSTQEPLLPEPKQLLKIPSVDQCESELLTKGEELTKVEHKKSRRRKKKEKFQCKQIYSDTVEEIRSPQLSDNLVKQENSISHLDVTKLENTSSSNDYVETFQLCSSEKNFLTQQENVTSQFDVTKSEETSLSVNDLENMHLNNNEKTHIAENQEEFVDVKNKERTTSNENESQEMNIAGTQPEAILEDEKGYNCTEENSFVGITNKDDTNQLESLSFEKENIDSVQVKKSEVSLLEDNNAEKDYLPPSSSINIDAERREGGLINTKDNEYVDQDVRGEANRTLIDKECKSMTEENTKLDQAEFLPSMAYLKPKKRLERSRRGRRPKTRKYAESSLFVPRYETQDFEHIVPAITTRSGGRRRRFSSTDKNRRTLRSDTAESLMPAEDLAQSFADTEGSFDDQIPISALNNAAKVSANRNDDLVLNADIKNKSEECMFNTKTTLSQEFNKEIVASDDNQVNSEKPSKIDVMEGTVESTKQEEPKKKRGRRKKSSTDYQPSQSSSPPHLPFVCNAQKSDMKSGETENKDNQSKEPRLLFSLSTLEKSPDQKPQKDCGNAYDVFEFRDSEDEEITFEKDIQNSFKERMMDTGRTVAHTHEHKQSEAEKERKPEELNHKTSHHEEKDMSGKEYVTELSQHGKIAITIRLHQKDGHDGSSASTAEVVKTSQAICAEDTKPFLSLSTEKTKDEVPSTPTSDAFLTGPCKSTRKAIQLQSQISKTSVDEIIEEVVKRYFIHPDPSEGNTEMAGSSQRITRRTRARRRSEDIITKVEDAHQEIESSITKHEPMFIIPDNVVKDHLSDPLKVSSTQGVITSTADSSGNSSEPETSKPETRMLLRSYRITRSTSRLESSRERSVSPRGLPDQIQEPVISQVEAKSPSVSISASNDSGPSVNPLPVLKVELPQLSSTIATQVVTSSVENSKIIEKKVESLPSLLEKDDDTDSRSSPIVLIDPVTGFLTPVNKKGEPTGVIQETSKISDAPTPSSFTERRLTGSKSSVTTVVTHSSNTSTKAGVLTLFEHTGDTPGTPVTYPQVLNPTVMERKIKKQEKSSSQITASNTQEMQVITTNTLTESNLQALKHGSVNVKHNSVISPTVTSSLPVSDYAETTSPVTITSSVSCSNTSRKDLSVGQPFVPIAQPMPGLPNTASSPYTSPLVVSVHQSHRSLKSSVMTTSSSQLSLPNHSPEVKTTAHKIGESSIGRTRTVHEVPSLKTEGNSTVDENVESVRTSTQTKTTTTHSSPSSEPKKSETTVLTCLSNISAPSSSKLTYTTSVEFTRTVQETVQTAPKALPVQPRVSIKQEMKGLGQPPIPSPSGMEPATTASTGKSGHPYAPKQNPSYYHQPNFPVVPHETTVHPGQSVLASTSSGGVIAELLQNPHLLQQRKEYLAAQHSVSAPGTQISERLTSQVCRSSGPGVGPIHGDIAVRLSNPTPPHTPTPPVTSSSHSLQAQELHSAHLAQGLHLRHPSQASLIMAPPPPLGIHPSDIPAYVHMYAAASHPHYAALHPELRAQHEAQARAAVAMGMTQRFGYPPIPTAAGFRQPVDPLVVHTALSEVKSENKANQRTDEKPISHKTTKVKQELKMPSTDHRSHEDHEQHQPHTSVESAKQHVITPSHPVGTGIQSSGHCSPAVHQLSPHISISQHERITDSPAVASPYASGQLRHPPSHLPVSRVEDTKSLECTPRLALPKSESESEMKPPAAHQNPPTTIPYHTLEMRGASGRLGPAIGAPAPGHLEGHPVPDRAHAVLSLKRDVPPHSREHHIVPGEPHPISDTLKKLPTHLIPYAHQSLPVSPGLHNLNTTSSSLPVTSVNPVLSPKGPVHSLRPPSASSTGGEVISSRRGSVHLIPQTGSEAPLSTPPPAHAMSQQTGVPRAQPQTPPHDSQVPPQGDSLLLQRYPVMWQGLLALKNDQAAVQMHFVSGNPLIAQASLPPMTEGGTPPVRIAQRMRLEQNQLEGVARKMQMLEEHCILLALPCGRDHMDVLQQSNNLRNGFINYLQLKQAAGIVNAAAPGSQQPAYVIHIFPSCDFSNENMARIAPDLLHSVSDIAHLLIIIATV